MTVREMLESCIEQLDQKAKEAFAGDDIKAFYNFTDAKYHCMKALGILRVARREINDK